MKYEIHLEQNRHHCSVKVDGKELEGVKRVEIVADIYNIPHIIITKLLRKDDVIEVDMDGKPLEQLFVTSPLPEETL